MSKKIVILLITICCLALTANAANKPFTLVIDAGHGGHDAGAVGAISKEKNLTLKFALAFGRMVERNCPDVKVIYTRKTDRFVELYRRAEIANTNKADLFISIHINALPRGRVARGFQTYTLGRSKRTGKSTGVMQNLEVAKRENAVILLEKDYKQTYQGYDPNSPESDIMFEFIQDKNIQNSVELAKYMQRYVCRATGRQDMGAQQDNLAVLRLSSMPGCLVELGFISTRDEEQYMNSKQAESQYATGLYNAFLAYWKQHDKNAKIPFRPEPEQTTPVMPTIVPENEIKKATPEPVPVQTEEAKPEDIKTEEVKLEETTIEETKPKEIKPVQQEEEKPVQPEPVVQPVDTPSVIIQQQSVDTAPVFKVQVLASSSKIKPSDSRLKGLEQVECYQDGSMYKYTTGASENYNEINQLRKRVAEKFPEAFIIAFKDGSRIDVNEAIQAFKRKRK